MRRLPLVANLLVGAGVLSSPARPRESRRASLRRLEASRRHRRRARPSRSAARRKGNPSDASSSRASASISSSSKAFPTRPFERAPDISSRTALPGGPDAAGNCVIAGHRDSFFRRLADARRNDLVRFHGPSGTTTYRLDERRIVKPEDVSAVAPTRDARLTLITCYPFSWTGSAPYRLVWKAERIDPKSPQTEDFRIARRQPL